MSVFETHEEYRRYMEVAVDTLKTLIRSLSAEECEAFSRRLMLDEGPTPADPLSLAASKIPLLAPGKDGDCQLVNFLELLCQVAVDVKWGGSKSLVDRLKHKS